MRLKAISVSISEDHRIIFKVKTQKGVRFLSAVTWLADVRCHPGDHEQCQLGVTAPDLLGWHLQPPASPADHMTGPRSALHEHVQQPIIEFSPCPLSLVVKW